MKIAVIGTGYVGLVTATCFAESGNDVVGVDVDKAKIATLESGQLPIYEPGLLELVQRNHKEGRLSFTTDFAKAVAPAKLIFIAVGTPQSHDGRADLKYVFDVADSIAKLLKSKPSAATGKIVITKSTVPVGTCRAIAERLAAVGFPPGVEVASNPEFLKEGAALDDFMKPDRVVVGVRSAEAAEVLRQLYSPFLRTENPFVVMSPESAEMTKYAANAMLATKISFINEIANLCDRVGADVNDVRKGMGHDQRIGFQFLHPGPGYGGSCFPKDVRAIMAAGEQHGAAMHLMQAVDAVNERQKRLLFRKVSEHFSELKGLTLGVWGLAFKPKTDDIREAPALTFLDAALAAGAKCQVHDPEAMTNVRAIFGDKLTYCEKPYDALKGADALILVTEWAEFRQPDFEQMKMLMRGRVVVDGRNIYEPKSMKALGFTYYSLGRARA